MDYRQYIPNDRPEVVKLCDKFKIEFPDNSLVFVAFNPHKHKIEGLIGLQGNIYIEPFISNNNSLVAVKLYKKIVDFIKHKNIKSVRCICSPRYKKLFEKAGFNQVNEDKIIMEKVF